MWSGAAKVTFVNGARSPVVDNPTVPLLTSSFFEEAGNALSAYLSVRRGAEGKRLRVGWLEGLRSSGV